MHTATFQTDGVEVFETFLEEHQRQHLLDELTQAQGDIDNASARTKRGVTFALRNVLRLQSIRDFAMSEVVSRLVVEMAGEALRPVRAILFDKTGDANWTVPWHQDRSIAVQERHEVAGFGPWSTKSGVVHVQPPLRILRRMLTLRFSLDACAVDNGPLRVIPRSHQQILEQQELEQMVEFNEQRPCTTAAGRVVIMRPLIVHASSPAKHASHRRVHIEYGPPTLAGGLDWAD